MNNTETPMTELPDGSGLCTATILSKEEAMALPPSERPLCYRMSSEIYHDVWESVGHASMCWEPRPSGETFDTLEASMVATKLCCKVADELDKVRAERDQWIEVAKQLVGALNDAPTSDWGSRNVAIDAFLKLKGED